MPPIDRAQGSNQTSRFGGVRLGTRGIMTRLWCACAAEARWALFEHFRDLRAPELENFLKVFLQIWGCSQAILDVWLHNRMIVVPHDDDQINKILLG